MASKNKGGRTDRKVAGKDLKAKRLEKQAKRDAAKAGNKSVDKTFSH